jgi:hypothetical protein
MNTNNPVNNNTEAKTNPLEKYGINLVSLAKK